jgi:hypothetical protein
LIPILLFLDSDDEEEEDLNDSNFDEFTGEIKPDPTVWLLVLGINGTFSQDFQSQVFLIKHSLSPLIQKLKYVHGWQKPGFERKITLDLLVFPSFRSFLYNMYFFYCVFSPRPLEKNHVSWPLRIVDEKLLVV